VPVLFVLSIVTGLVGQIVSRASLFVASGIIFGAAVAGAGRQLFLDVSTASRKRVAACTDALVLYGVEVSPRRTQDATGLQAFLPHVAVLEFPDDAATHYAQIRADLKKRGQMIGANDLFIAAHARSLGLRLVTNNIAEFTGVKGLTLAFI
jgi:predicted nucleic acid-binding protein